MEAAPRPIDEQKPGEGGVVTMAREAEPSAPQNLAPGPTSEGLKAQTKVGGVRNVRKDIPAKKDRLEPLKIDMSKHFLIPPTSAQLSLQCLECHIIFSDHKSKERHLKQSHPAEYEQCMLGDALFACYVCDRHFACSTELMVHQRAHTEKQPFKCPICGEAFRRSSELTIHKKVHYSLHGYTCLECGKPCKTLTLLKYHRRTHTGERPYVCKDCGKRFSMSKALQKHLLTHVQEEDMEAGGTILLTPTGDTTHIKKLAVSLQGKPAITFSCSLCDGIFKTAKTRLQHMKLKHSQGRGTAQNLITEKGEHRKEGQSMEAHTEIPPEQTLQHLQTFVQGQALQQMETLGQEQMQELISTFGHEQVKDKVEVMGHEQLQVQMDTREQELAERQTNEIESTQEQTETLRQEQTSIQMETLGPEQAQRKTETLGLEQTQRQTETLGLEQTQRQTGTSDLEQTQGQMETVGLLQIQRQIEILEPEQTQGQRKIIEVEQTQLQTETLELDLTQGQMETVVLEQTQGHVEMMQLEHSGQLKKVEIGQTNVKLDALAVEQRDSTMETAESELTQVQMESVELELTQVQVETVELELTEVQVGTMELDLTQIQVESTEFELTQVQVQTAELGQTQKQTDSWEQMETEPPKESHEGVALQQTRAEENKETCQKPEPTQQLSGNTPQEQTLTQMQRHTPTPCLSLLQANRPEQHTSQHQGIQLHTLNFQYLPKHAENAQIQPLQEGLIAAHTRTQTFLKGFPQAQSMKTTPEGKSAKHFQSLVLEREFPGCAQPEKELKQHSETQPKVKRTKRSRSKKERLIVRFVAPEKVKQKPLQTHQTHLKDGHKQQKTHVKPQSAQKAQLQPKVVKEKKRKKKEKCEKTVTAQTLLQDKMVHLPVQKILQVTEQTQPMQVKKKKEQTQKSATAEKMKEQLSLQMPKKKKKISQKGKLKNQERIPPEKKQKKMQEKNKKQSHIPENQEQIKQQSLLLLKGHKQPQLKVHKLDPSKTQQQPQQLMPCQSETHKPQQDPQMLPAQKQQKFKKPQQQKEKPNQKPQRQPKTKPKGKQQQAVLLLPLLLPSPLSSPLKVKPMTNRKRKASKIRVAETVLGSPQARRALACQDCGERFSEVLALEEHTAAVHALVIKPGKFNSDSTVFKDISRTDGETSLGFSAKRLTQETLDQGQDFTSLHELGVGETPTLLNPGAGALQNQEGDRVKVVGVAALGGELSLALDLTPKASEGTLGNTIHTDNFGMQVATDWDMEVEMGEIGLGDRVERVSFPALNPSPSLSFAAACLEGEGKEGGATNWDSVVGTVPRVTSDFSVSASGHSQDLKTQQREEFDEIVKCSKDCPEETRQGGTPSGVLHVEDAPLDAAPSSPPSICVLSSSLCDSSHTTPLDTLNHNQSLNLSPATQLQDFTQLETAKTEGQMEGKGFEDKNEDKEEPSSGLQLITSCQEPQSVTEEEIKEELLLEVDIVTIGDQNMEGNTLCQDSSHVLDSIPHAYHTATCQLQIETTQSFQRITADTSTQVKNQDLNANVSTAVIHSNAHGIFCSKDCSEIKQEEEEEEVESMEGGRRRVEGDSTGRSCRRGHGGDQRGGRRRVEADVMKETESEAEGCQVILQLQPLTSDSPVKEEDGVELLHRSKSSPLHQQENTRQRCDQEELLSGACIPESCLPASLEESSDEQIVFELESVTTSVGVLKTEDGMETEGVGEQVRGAGHCHSPSILLERFLTGRERSEGDVEQCQNELRNNNRPQVDRTSSGFSLEAGPQNDAGRMTLMGSVMGQVIKVEDYSSNLIPCPNGQSATPGREGAVVISQVDPCEEQQGVQVFLVKEEDPLILDAPQAFPEHGQSEFPEEEMRVEGNTCADSEAASLEDREGGRDGEMEAASISPLVLGGGVRGNEQCIFFRMKEEENEVALEPPQREHGLSVLLVSRAAALSQRANSSHTDAEGPLVSDLHSGPYTDSSGIWVSMPPGCGAEQGVAEIEECEQDTERSIQMGTQQNVYVCTGEGELNTEQQSSKELLEFLQQKSDAEHSDTSDSEPEGEAYAMACYHDSGSGGSMITNEISSKKCDCSILNIPVQGRSGDSATNGRGEGGGGGNEGKTPIEYFSQYLDWETWEEIAHCTSTLFGTPNSVIAKEVAQFVGIHIAMGTLKFPDKKLYWQNFTRVPLIADAMPASRFAQLARKLRLAYQPEDSELPVSTGMDEGSACGDRGVACVEGPGNQLNTGHRVDTEGPQVPDISHKTRKTDTVSHRDMATHRFEDGVVEQRPGDPRHTSQHCDTAGLAQMSARLPAGSVGAEHTHNTRSRTHYTRKRAWKSSDVQTLGDKSRMQNVSNAHSNAQRSDGGHSSESTCTVNTDPLWQVRGVLDRVRSGCLLLSHEGNYGIDQHPLHLGRCRKRKSLKNSHPALQCAVLLGAGGLVLDLNLSLNDSDREDTLQKIIPRNKENGEGLVFLCKEELCTPAVLERLLVNGVRSAGRVGGVKGGVGDEFVSSDGRLALLRCQQGFILSTLTKRQAHQVSLAKDFEGAQKDAQLNRDLLNLYSTPLSASSPTRWPQSILWHLTDLALVNSWLQFRQDRGHSRKSPNLMAFRLEVAKALIHTNGFNMPHSAPPHPPAPKLPGQDRAPSPAPLPAAPLPDAAIRYDGLGHWPEQLAEGEGARCRFGGCDRTSRVRCLKCCIFLCISRNHNCFLKFHSQGSI